MELIIAIVLFAAIVAVWLFLPSAPDETALGHSAAVPAAGKAGRVV